MVFLKLDLATPTPTRLVIGLSISWLGFFTALLAARFRLRSVPVQVSAYTEPPLQVNMPMGPLDAGLIILIAS